MASRRWLIAGISILLAQASSGQTPIRSGEYLDGTITQAGQTNQYTFLGQAGDTVYIRMAENPNTAFAPAFEVRGALGELLGIEHHFLVAEGKFAITNTGLHSIFARDFGPETGSYSISMVRMPGYPLSANDPDVCPIGSGDTLAGIIDRPGDLDAAMFAAVAGDTATVRMSDTNGPLFSCYFHIYDPVGERLGFAFDTNTAEKVVAITSNGIYTALCMELQNGVGPYSVNVVLAGGNTTDDIDGDGISNADELKAWTDPFDSNSQLRVTHVMLPSSNAVSIRWPTVGGMRYRTQYSDDLNTMPFADIPLTAIEETEADVGEGQADTAEFTDDFTAPQGLPTNMTRHYRVRTVPQ
jgi:hypothetical protein